MSNKNYQEIIEELQMRVDLLEKAIKKNSKKADKDYDGDGEIESGTEEYLGSRSNAIKKAIAKRKDKKIEEALDRVGGNLDSASPNVRSLAARVDMNSPILEATLKLMNSKKSPNSNIKLKDNGSKIELSEKVIYGGFPTTGKE